MSYIIIAIIAYFVGVAKGEKNIIEREERILFEQWKMEMKEKAARQD